MSSTSEGIQASIAQTLHAQAQQNEMLVARVRLLMVALALAGHSAMHYFPLGPVPAVPLFIILLTIVWGAWALAIMAMLRASSYPAWVPFVVPAVDGLMLVTLHVFTWRALSNSVEMGQVINVSYAITCTLLTASGSLRITRAAAVWSSLVGAATLAIGLTWVAPSITWIFPSALVLGMGAYSWWMRAIVRRAVQSEVGKSTLRRFLPSGVVDQAHQSALPFLSEPRSVEATILVSDLRGFTALSEALPPVEVLDLLNEIQGAFAHAIHASGGTVDKFMGDGMLAVFGAVLPLPDHADRAIAAAAGLHDALIAVNAARALRHQPPLAMGVGIHSGPVIAGCLGGAERLEFTVLGAVVNTASRLEGLTKELKVEVLVSAETHRRLQRPHSLATRGAVPIRGRVEPIEVFTWSPAG